MYIPKHMDWVYPTLEIAAGFFAHKVLEPGMQTTLLVQLPFAVVGMFHAAFIYRAEGNAEKYYQSVDYGQTARGQVFTERAKENKPQLKVMGQVFAKTVEPVRMNEERKMANILLHQKRHNFDVKLTEAYWIESKPRRFGGSRDEFVAVLDKWGRWRIIERKNPNNPKSSYMVQDWRGLELVAAGEELPPPLPQL